MRHRDQGSYPTITPVLVSPLFFYVNHPALALEEEIGTHDKAIQKYDLYYSENFSTNFKIAPYQLSCIIFSI